MSGKDLEPVTAFFPSIDRNLIRDLDRHLRSTQQTVEAPPETVAVTGRPDIAGVLEAVDHAASSMASMAERIQELEAQNHQLDATNHQLTAQLGEVVQQRDATIANLNTESDRAQRLEALAAHHVSRATALERDLGVTRADLAKVVDAITSALGTPSGTTG